MRRCSKLIIGRIHKAVGGGVGILTMITLLLLSMREYQVIKLAIGIGPL
jgi:hypothetical protein